MKMYILKQTPYDGKKLKPGSTVDVKDKAAVRLLKATRKAIPEEEATDEIKARVKARFAQKKEQDDGKK